MKKFLFLIILYFSCFNVYSQGHDQLTSGQIYEELEKFNFLGSALYVAAHPDDENTRLISYLSNGLHARTAYLSLTRGDGGQNLIGTEIRDLLGILRSQELQMARATDGGQQFFTRANDFGYSKHPDETLKIWNKDEVFADIMSVIQTFKPDIIINRFDHRTPGKTHGHHTSSAMLSEEAFNKCIELNRNELGTEKPWKVRRQFFNTSWWFYGGRDKFAEADKSNLVSLEVGGFYPTLGISNNEISGLARSKHRSQGFGSSGSRGSQQEFLELINGDMPNDRENIFDGINTSWTRVEGGAAIHELMTQILDDFNFKNPVDAVKELLKVQELLEQIEDEHWKTIKQKHLSEIIQACMGLFIEASTTELQSTHGDSVEVQIEITNRSNIDVSLVSYSINDVEYIPTSRLNSYEESKWYKKVFISDDIKFSNPYWLDEEGTLGTFRVDDESIRTAPQSDAALSAQFTLNIEGQELQVIKDVIHKTVNPSIGEIRQPFAIIPPATISFNKEMYLFSDQTDQRIDVRVRATTDNLKGKLYFNLPPSWSINPSEIEFDIPNKSMEQSFAFTLHAPEALSEGRIEAFVDVNDDSYSKTLIEIEYSHIPIQTILLPARAKLVKVPLKKGGKNIGYLMGAGDKMPLSLSNVGYNVEEIYAEQLDGLNLKKYDAIVIGIRAYNTLESLKLYNKALFDYVNEGGTLITQYNTSRRLNFDHLAPYPIRLSRKRVTDEYAEIRIINPEHPALNEPNVISSLDFDDWVQERGLYFPEEWDNQYETLISCNDKGEEPLDGSILIAPHGDGFFVYTSISWFRQLPAGVPGAYRLFANLLALSSPTQRP